MMFFSKKKWREDKPSTFKHFRFRKEEDFESRAVRFYRYGYKSKNLYPKFFYSVDELNGFSDCLYGLNFGMVSELKDKEDKIEIVSGDCWKAELRYSETCSHGVPEIEIWHKRDYYSWGTVCIIRKSEKLVIMQTEIEYMITKFVEDMDKKGDYAPY